MFGMHFQWKRKSASVDPLRWFQGDGVDYKAKLIGVREVAAPTDDAMCQEAMILCKATAKMSGRHKPRILFNVSIDGLKVKNEQGETLQTFSAKEVSYVSRDPTDERAFGFVSQTPEHTFKFYAIKTAETSDYAIMSVRDMFVNMYEMKKKQQSLSDSKLLDIRDSVGADSRTTATEDGETTPTLDRISAILDGSCMKKKKKKQVKTTAHDTTDEPNNIKEPEKKVTSDFKLLDLKDMDDYTKTNGAKDEENKAGDSTMELDPFACDFNDTLSVVRTL